jgi:outer membrane protein TolC
MTALHTVLLVLAIAGDLPPASGGDAPAELLSLADAKRLARENNLDIQIARERLAKASILSKKAWAVLLPTISANASIVRNNTAIEIPFGLPEELRPVFEGLGQPFPDPQLVTIQELYQKNASVNFAWVLLNGRSVPLLQNAYSTVEVAELSYAQAESALQYGTALAYYNVMNAQQQTAIRRRALDVASEHLKLSRAKVEIGEATQVVALRSEVEVATDEQLLLQAAHAERIAKRALATLIGRVDAAGDFAPFRVEQPNAEPAPIPDDLVETAYAERLDLKTQKLQLEIAERSKLESWMKFLPQLVGTGSYRWSDVQGFSGENTNWQLGLALRWTLFEGGLTYWELQERAHDVNAAALAVEKARQDIAQQVHEARLNLETAEANRAAARRRIDLAAKSAQLVRAQFEVGAATQLDVIDVNRALADAETADALAGLGVDLARLSLEQVLLSPTQSAPADAASTTAAGIPTASAPVGPATSQPDASGLPGVP